MSLAPEVLTELVLLGAPVLCVDTCTILDVIRDITREAMRISDAQAARALLAAAEDRRSLVVLLADQVSIELEANAGNVRKEGDEAIARFKKQSSRIHGIATAFGATEPLQLEYLNNHVARANAQFDRWRQFARRLSNHPDIAGRALARVNGPRTPARKGKESMKDCVIVESYLEAARQLRTAGHRARKRAANTR